MQLTGHGPSRLGDRRVSEAAAAAATLANPSRGSKGRPVITAEEEDEVEEEGEVEEEDEAEEPTTASKSASALKRKTKVSAAAAPTEEGMGLVGVRTPAATPKPLRKADGGVGAAARTPKTERPPRDGSPHPMSEDKPAVPLSSKVKQRPRLDAAHSSGGGLAAASSGKKKARVA